MPAKRKNTHKKTIKKKTARKKAAGKKAAKKKTAAAKPAGELITLGFPVVGIGASAGGLEAMGELLKFLPSNIGMAFVLVQHLAP